jgi:type IV pilus assembly protein PilB
MGIEPFLVGSALDAVLAQRLARRLCRKCKEPYAPAPETLTSVLHWPAERPPPTIYRAVGCSSCSHTGYRGRLALHEVMTVGEEIERLAVGRASAATIAKAAQEGGMETLREDGLAKVISGDTSLEELFRVVT